jgi:tetratricopeptide (TPR) repeat protein/predicted Ser/Thr protein kinase
MPPDAQRIAELVKSALERPPEDRASFLDDECRSDPAMRAEIESLLQEQEGSSEFLETSALHLAAKSFMREGAFRAGQTIGDYEIISLIGSGGMGEVYLAEDGQLHRKVALKLVRRGMDSDDIIRHFKHEEHLLASLNHPNIAQLYGSGVSVDGIPFFAMEYVEGQRLDEYCDERGLGTKERLQLFCKVCSAVTYAHQRLVIHRDLKPANIRVTAAGEPKLLDFGIAKLLDSENAPSRGQTLTLQGVMTPEYASPEQVRGESMTTASDVYSLGVVLYKLLTGQSPYRTKTNRPDEIVRAITEQEPTRPSTVVASASRPWSMGWKPMPQLRGDLDNIVLMAMRKEPSRRYSSVGQFSADIQRHLDGLPVIARKDTFTYRASKFIRRHRVAVAAAFLISISLVGGMITTTWQAQVARHEKAKAEDVKNALVRMLNYSNPFVFSPQNNGQKTVKEILDETAKQLENGEFSNQPEIKVELEQIIAECYFGEGNYALGSKYTQEYLDLHRKLYGENDIKTLVASEQRAFMLFAEGKLTESEKHYRKILPLLRNETRKGNIKAENLADALNNFGALRRTQGDSKEAELSFRESLALSSQMPKESLYIIGPTRSTLASTLADQGRFEEALQTAREAVAEYRQREETGTPNFGFTLTVLGGFLTEKGDYAEADANLHEAEAIQRKFLNPSSLWLGDNLRNQAISYYQQGRYAEALSKVTEALEIYRETFGTHYDNYPTALITQGLSQAKTGQPKEGEKILREAVKIRTESLPKEHYWVALANSALGECLTIQQRYNEAEPLLLGSYESLNNSEGRNNPRTRLALQRLIELYEKWRKPDLAARYRAML